MLFTPGPWHVEDWSNKVNEGSFSGSIKDEAGNSIFAGPFSFEALRGATTEEAKANALLISASPTMYEVLERFAAAANKIIEDGGTPTFEHMKELNRCRRWACDILEQVTPELYKKDDKSA
jgi:hypothetical protein